MMLIVPKWTHCLIDEYALRKETIKSTREGGIPIQTAWWAVYKDGERRVQQWITMLAMAHSGSSADSGKLSRWEKQVAELQRANRSRSPGRQRLVLCRLGIIVLFAATGSSSSIRQGKWRGQKKVKKGTKERFGRSASAQTEITIR